MTRRDRRPRHASPSRAASSPSCIRSARARITPCSSITWACPRSTSASPGRYGVYHSIYDDFTWMEKFGDPEFLTHTMAARLYTVLVMRAGGGRRAAVPVRPPTARRCAITSTSSA